MTIEEALQLDTHRREKIGGCGDGGCIVFVRPGMHTNGGCRCNKEAIKMSRLSSSYREFRNDITTIKVNDRLT